MTDKNKSIKTIHHLLDYDIRKLSIAEMQLERMLKRWIIKANSVKLKTVLQKYHDLIGDHISKLKSFHEEDHINLLSINNRIMQALIDETEEKLNNCADTGIKDASLIASIQTINHFKISIYGTAKAFANILGLEKGEVFFNKAEINEKKIDDKLSQLAALEINKESQILITFHS